MTSYEEESETVFPAELNGSVEAIEFGRKIGK